MQVHIDEMAEQAQGMRAAVLFSFLFLSLCGRIGLPFQIAAVLAFSMPNVIPALDDNQATPTAGRTPTRMLHLTESALAVLAVSACANAPMKCFNAGGCLAWLPRAN